MAGAGVQFATQNSNDYSGEGYHAIPLSSEWVLCEHEYTCSKEGINRILINFGKNAATFYLDNIKFGVKKATTRALTRGTSITYIPKSTEEKKTALLSAMEAWIKGMAQHPGMERVTEWDVINEPIGDNSKWRGFDNTFMD